MGFNNDIPSERINKFILSCECASDLSRFVNVIGNEIGALISCNYTLAVFKNSSGRFVDLSHTNYPVQWSNALMEYYLDLASETSGDMFGNRVSSTIHFVDWSQTPFTELVTDYVRICGLNHSCFVFLYDSYDTVRTVLVFDKTQAEPFSDIEFETLRILYPHLNNLHKKFFQFTTNPIGAKSKAQLHISGLTNREMEIVTFLCQGVSPANISKTLKISPGTVQRHIANIYEKMSVNSLQELLVRLLG